MSYFANVSKIASKNLHTYPSGHDEYSQAEPAKPAQSAPTFQKYLSILPLVVSDLPEVRQKQAKKYLILSLFAPFQAENPYRWSAGGLLEMPELIFAGYYIARMQQMTPTPPYLGSKKALYPHNFSHQKSRKKFAPRNHNFSHQKSRKKSPWSDWKKFRKKFAGKCFGVRESPQSCRKGARGAKI